jgi:RHS repeat-associated protein
MRLRVRKDYTWNAGYGQWQLTGETRYVYDGMRVIQERNAGNTPTVAYTRGLDLSGSLEGAGGIGGLLARSHGYSGGTWGTHNFYHADGGGNVTYLINSSQARVAEYRYDPYGRALYSYDSLPGGGNRYRFSSKELVTSGNLYYYGYRFYDPNLQRWPNRDPIGEEGFKSTARDVKGGQSDGPNLYTFVRNDGVNHVDWNGLYIIPIPPFVDLYPDVPPDPSKTHIECFYCNNRCLYYIACFMRRPGSSPTLNPVAFRACMAPIDPALIAACRSGNVAAMRSLTRRAKNCFDHHW